jgi:hypothetical protein
VEVVPKEGDEGVPTAYQPSLLTIEAVKEAMMAILGDGWIYILTCIIGEEGVSGEIWKGVGGSRYGIGILGGQ